MERIKRPQRSPASGGLAGYRGVSPWWGSGAEVPCDFQSPQVFAGLPCAETALLVITLCEGSAPNSRVRGVLQCSTGRVMRTVTLVAIGVRGRWTVRSCPPARRTYLMSLRRTSIGFHLRLPSDVLRICALTRLPAVLWGAIPIPSCFSWYIHDVLVKAPRFESVGDDAE